MNIFHLRRPSIVGVIDASMFLFVFVCIARVLDINLFEDAALPFLLVALAIVGWRGAVSARLIHSGKDGFGRGASEGFFWGGGIMLALQAGMDPFQWHALLTIGLPIAVVTGVIGALVGISLLFMNRMLVRGRILPGQDAQSCCTSESIEAAQSRAIRDNSSFHSLSKRSKAIVALVTIGAIVGVIMSFGHRQLQIAPSKISQGTSKAASSVLPMHQLVISKALPGYTIFRNEDFLQDEHQLRKFLTSDEIAEKNAREQGIIEGRFNDDALQDFAALVINRSIKQETDAHETNGEKKREEFSVRLVICLGTKQTADYQCDILSTLDGDFVSLPYWVEFKVFKAPGEFSCGDVENQVTAEDTSVQAFYPEGWGSKEGAVQLGVAARRLHLNYDGVGMYAIGRNYGWTLVRQADGSYLNCANAD